MDEGKRGDRKPESARKKNKRNKTGETYKTDRMRKKTQFHRTRAFKKRTTQEQNKMKRQIIRDEERKAQ